MIKFISRIRQQKTNVHQQKITIHQCFYAVYQKSLFYRIFIQKKLIIFELRKNERES